MAGSSASMSKEAEAVFAQMTMPCAKCGRAGRKWQFQSEYISGQCPSIGYSCIDCLPAVINGSWGLCEDDVIRPTSPHTHPPVIRTGTRGR